ncbi:DUF1564 domain-containing protein [Leptospira yasudae]|uniref:DUF1564 domain-containing protein n=1 Tax=Leptospira yasudae TaxID=2202201 RepID=A0ABX9M036_9LEPT|nr:DUF1564 domain-containing protein [Leptospira yasudae]RHX78619.1 DUF1564 domain-containing protein [Leptospira yasudae]
MGNIILAETQKVRKRWIVDGESSVETFLIPERYWTGLNEKDRKNLPKRIPTLIRRYAKYIVAMPRLNSKPGKTMYQKDQGPLIRMNIRMGTGIVSILASFAASHGVSRCFLVNYLLWLDEIGVGNSIVETVSVGTPTFHDVYRNILTLDFNSNTITREFQFEPNPIYAQNLDYRNYFSRKIFEDN